MPFPHEPPPVSRRGFFTRGLAEVLGHAVDALGERVEASASRPPGALPEGAFVAACTRCGDCMTACPAGAIVRLDAAGMAAGTPTIDPAATACLACPDMPCAAACPTGALERPEDGWRGVRLGRIAIAGSCIAFRDVECGVCARVCPIGADALRLDEAGIPVVGDACVGCGTCIGACVTSPSSITIEPMRFTT